MENVLDYNKWEDKLWALYDSIFKDASYTIKDGVISLISMLQLRSK